MSRSDERKDAAAFGLPEGWRVKSISNGIAPRYIFYDNNGSRFDSLVKLKEKLGELPQKLLSHYEGVRNSKDVGAGHEEELKDAAAMGLPQGWRIKSISNGGTRRYVYWDDIGTRIDSMTKLRERLGELPPGLKTRSLKQATGTGDEGRSAPSAATAAAPISGGATKQPPVPAQPPSQELDAEVEALQSSAASTDGSGYILLACADGSCWVVLPDDVIVVDLDAISRRLESSSWTPLNATDLPDRARRRDFGGSVAVSLYRAGGRLLVRDANRRIAEDVGTLLTGTWLSADA